MLLSMSMSSMQHTVRMAASMRGWSACCGFTGSSASNLASTSTSTSAWRALPSTTATYQQARSRTTLAPRRTKYRKAFKGRIPVKTGGSITGTLLEHGDFGIRVTQETRLSAKQLQSASDALKRGIKPVKGARVYLRVFPDIPVCIKGNETRMGKGKGTFEYWACRAQVGKVIFEIGGGGIAEQIAKDALRLAMAKLPVKSEFVTRSSLPRLGHQLVPLDHKPIIAGSTIPAPSIAASTVAPAS